MRTRVFGCCVRYAVSVALLTPTFRRRIPTAFRLRRPSEQPLEFRDDSIATKAPPRSDGEPRRSNCRPSLLRFKMPRRMGSTPQDQHPSKEVSHWKESN